MFAYHGSRYDPQHFLRIGVAAVAQAKWRADEADQVNA